MSDDRLAQMPAKLRQEVLECATAKQISLEWLINLYRAGFNAKLGATGDRPYGDLGGGDEGELRAAIAVDVPNGVLRIVFGKPIAWLALPAGHARQFAKMLTDSAAELEKKLP
jgi:hypothetical protein